MTADARAETTESTFFESLFDSLSSVEVQQNFRIVARGILVHEDFQPRLLETYQRWLQDVTGSTGEKSTAKCCRRLFQSETPPLYYLLDGKICIPGFLLPCDEIPAVKNKIPRSQANLMDTRSYLHAKDPILQRISNVSTRLDAQQGLCLRIKTKSEEFELTSEALKHFAEAARNTEMVLKERPEVAGPLRSCLTAAHFCISRARRIDKDSRLLVPQAENRKPHSCFLRYRSLVFVTAADSSTIVGCYGLDDKALSQFVRSELTNHKSSVRTRQAPGKKNNPRILGSLQVKRREYVLYARALLRFISSAAKVSTVRKEMPPLYTVNNCIKQLKLILQDAEKADDPKTGKRPQKKEKGPPSITLRNGPWHFTMNRGSHLIDCTVQHRRSKPIRKRIENKPAERKGPPKKGRPRPGKPGRRRRPPRKKPDPAK